MTTDTLTLNDIKYSFVLSFRAMVDFEKLANKSIDKAQSMEDFSYLAWCGLKAGARKDGKPFKLEYEQWLDMLDDDLTLLPTAVDLITKVSLDKEKAVKKNMKKS